MPVGRLLQCRVISQFDSARSACNVRVQAFVKIPDVRYALSVFRSDVLSLCMDYVVLAVDPASVDDLVDGNLPGCKSHRLAGDSWYIVRVGITVHVVVHDIVPFLVGLQIKHLQKARRNNQRAYPPVEELIYRNRRNTILHCRLYVRWEVVHLITRSSLLGVYPLIMISYIHQIIN